ncbi:hypothetical protein OPIT5_08295 [Opitutaceae bacterium TAV5]|nr:hypothetical protein OPIT5_08295 [Opitutaceae bacterium TAV5]
MKKPRSDSKLKSLPQHQQETLRRWLLEENVSYEDARERVHMDFGVKVSKGAIQNFYATCRSLEERDHAREFAEAICASAEGDGANFEQATLRLVREKAFILARMEGAESINELATLAKVLGESAKLEIKKRELALNLEKFRQQVKSDIEKGLDALHAEIKGNAEALQLFERFKAAVMRSAGGDD